jgi:hypothetical protein
LPLVVSLVFPIYQGNIDVELCIVTAVVGLALGAASSVEQYLPFFRPLSDHGNLVSGLATSLAPAIGATLFTLIALTIVKRKHIHGMPTLCNAHQGMM